MSLYTVTAHSRTGRAVAAGGRAWGAIPVTIACTEADLRDLWTKRDALNITFPAGWTSPDGTQPGGPDPNADTLALAEEATTTGNTTLARSHVAEAAKAAAETPALPSGTIPAAAIPRFCCRVGADPRADQVNADIAAGHSLRTLTATYQIPKSTMADHKAKCLRNKVYGASPDTMTKTAASPAAEDQRKEQANGQTVSEAASQRTGGGGGRTEARTVPDTSPDTSGRVTQFARQASVGLSQVQREEAERVRIVADTVFLGKWNDRATVIGLSKQWGIPEEEVQRIHALASAKVAANRGSRRAALESSVAATKVVRDRARDEALRAWIDAERAEKAHDPRLAKQCRKRAGQHEAQQLKFQQHLDGLLGLTGKSGVTLNVSYTTHPDFTELWRVIGRCLDTRAPGLAAKILGDIAVFEDGGDEALDEHLAESLANEGAIVVIGEPVTAEDP